MREKITTILQDIRPEFEFVGVQDFFAEGLLDSFDLITLVAALDQEFHISIDGLDIVPENFCNIDAIRRLVHKNGVL